MPNQQQSQGILKTTAHDLEQYQPHLHLNDIYESQALTQYFNTSKEPKANKIYASELQSYAVQHISYGIMKGQIQIEGQRTDLDAMFMQSRIKAEEQKIDNDKVKRQLIEAQLQYLKEQLGERKTKKLPQNQQQVDMSEHFTAVFSKKQHQQFLQKINKERIERAKSKKKNQKSQKQKQQEEEKKRIMEQQERIKKEKQQKKKRFIQKMQQNKMIKQKKQKQMEQSNKRLAQIKSKKVLYELAEQKYQKEVLLPNLEEKKKKLREIRQINRAFNPQQLKNHETQYLKKREESLENSLARVKHQQWNYTKPQRSARMIKILEKQAIQNKLKLEEKKRILDQKIRRREQYISQMKKRDPPKIDQKKRQQVLRRKGLIHSEEKLKSGKPDGKILGMNYLEEAKKQARKSANINDRLNNQTQSLDNKASQMKQRSLTNYLDSSRNKNEYNQIRQKRIQKLLHQHDGDKFQKIQKLQVEATRLSEEQKRHDEKRKFSHKRQRGQFDQGQVESIKLLMTSIKAKIGIIDTFNKQ